MAADKTADEALRRAVEEELEWEPSVDARHVRVEVDDSVVTLSGYVGSYSQKWTAERGRARPGRSGVESDIEVRLETQDERSDADLAKAPVRALERNLLAAADHLRVAAEDGWITLWSDEVVPRGIVRTWAEREEAGRVAWSAPGVTAVRNEIQVKAAA